MSGKVKANLWLSTYVESGISPRAYLQEEVPPTRIVQEIFAASTMRQIRQCLQQNSARSLLWQHSAVRHLQLQQRQVSKRVGNC